jgi:hypothetical protein
LAGFSVCANPFQTMTEENLLKPTSYVKSVAYDDGVQKSPWHKTGTKWHKRSEQLVGVLFASITDGVAQLGGLAGDSEPV